MMSLYSAQLAHLLVADLGQSFSFANGTVLTKSEKWCRRNYIGKIQFNDLNYV